MRRAVERFARRWWAGELGAAGQALSLVARPAAWVWAGAGRLGALRHRPPESLEGLHVVSVGNLAVGGTGKTPVSGWAAGVLSAAGVPTCVLVGRAGADEAALHARWNPTVRVLSGSDRTANARTARAAGFVVAVLDDGFQHRRLARDLDLVLLSADDPFPAPVLPCGPYREGAAALDRGDAILITRRSASIEVARALAERVGRASPTPIIGGVNLSAGSWTHLDGARCPPPAGDVLATCGVARPDAFASAVARVVGGGVELVAFRDHHAYASADLAALRKRAGGRPIVLTEKDAVKLSDEISAADDVFVMLDRFAWDWGEEALRTRLLAIGAGAARS